MKKTYLNATTSVVSLQNQNVILGTSIVGYDNPVTDPDPEEQPVVGG